MKTCPMRPQPIPNATEPSKSCASTFPPRGTLHLSAPSGFFQSSTACHTAMLGRSPPRATIAREGSHAAVGGGEGRKGSGTAKKERTLEGRVIPARASPREKVMPRKKAWSLATRGERGRREVRLVQSGGRERRMGRAKSAMAVLEGLERKTGMGLSSMRPVGARREVMRAAEKKDTTAARERFERRASPRSMCPLVHPFASCKGLSAVSIAKICAQNGASEADERTRAHLRAGPDEQPRGHRPRDADLRDAHRCVEDGGADNLFQLWAEEPKEGATSDEASEGGEFPAVRVVQRRRLRA